MMFWNRKKTLSLASTLQRRFSRVELDLRARICNLNSLAQCSGTNVSCIEFPKLLEEVKDIARGVTRSPPPLSREQAAFLLFHHLNCAKNLVIPSATRAALEKTTLPDTALLDIGILKKKKFDKERTLLDSMECIDVNQIDTLSISTIVTNDVVLPAFERAVEKCHFEQVYWSARIMKSADSCKQRFLLRKKLSLCAQKMKTLQEEYNKFSKVQAVGSPLPWSCRLFQNHVRN